MKKFNISKDNKYQIIIALLVFVIGFSFSFTPKTFEEVPKSDIETIEGGPFLRMVYIGASGCSYSNSKQNHKKVREIKKYFRGFAHRNDLKYITTGISQDKYAITGINYLKKTGPYDEVLTGGSWYNLGINHYVWNKIPGRAATPQILFTLTKFEMIPAGPQIAKLERKEELYQRFTGVTEIQKLYSLVKESKDHQIKELLGF